MSKRVSVIRHYGQINQENIPEGAENWKVVLKTKEAGQMVSSSCLIYMPSQKQAKDLASRYLLQVNPGEVISCQATRYPR